LDVDDIVKTNHISSQIKELSIIQFGSLELVVLQKHGLLNPITQEGFLTTNLFDKIIINMTTCSKVEEEISEEDDRQECSLREMNETLATLEIIPMCLN